MPACYKCHYNICICHYCYYLIVYFADVTYYFIYHICYLQNKHDVSLLSMVNNHVIQSTIDLITTIITNIVTTAAHTNNKDYTSYLHHFSAYYL